MSLDESRNDAAYNLGRLFVAFEDLQYAANPDVDLNSTIADKYLSSACATPSLVFPVLLDLVQAYLKKVRRDKRGAAISLEREIMERLDCLEGFPANLSMYEQCDFYLGYYHQKLHNINKRLSAGADKESEELSASNQSQEA